MAHLDKENYSNFVWEFKVKSGDTTPTVGVRAVSIDENLIASSIAQSDEKLATSGGVYTFVNSLITTTIDDKSTDTQIPSAKAVYEKIKDLGGVNIAGPYNSLDEITAPKNNTIYLVKKSTEKTNNKYDEYLYTNNAFELLGEFEISLTDYVKKTDYASASTGGVIKSSTEDGKISVDANGIASLNGYDDLLTEDDLSDYYKMSAAEKTAGTGTLYPAADKTKLSSVADSATKTEIDTATKKISVTDSTGTKTDITIPDAATPAYDTIKVVGDTTSSTTASSGKTIVFKQGPGIKLTTGGDSDGNPTINIKVDTTDVIDIAYEIPDDTTKDGAIPTVKAVKDYVEGGSGGSKPTYSNGTIDLT